MASFVVSSGASLLATGLLGGTLGCLPSLGLPSCFFGPALVGKVLFKLGCEGWVDDTTVLVVCVTTGLSEVCTPDENRLVGAT